MKKTGIIAAMDEEVEVVSKLMDSKKVEKKYELEFIEGNINNSNIVLVKCGIGKVNAARCTQILINNYHVDEVINVGSAGSVNDNLNIGDIVIGQTTVQHDFDITAFGHDKGYISNVGKIFESDEQLINRIQSASNTISNCNVKKGIIATGDIFCTSIEMKEKIRDKFNADCVEMEGAAIAQVCTLDNIPFAIIRSISDKPNGNNNMDFNTFLEQSVKNYADIINGLF